MYTHKIEGAWSIPSVTLTRGALRFGERIVSARESISSEIGRRDIRDDSIYRARYTYTCTRADTGYANPRPPPPRPRRESLIAFNKPRAPREAIVARDRSA